MQKVNRDTLSFAMKCSSVTVNGVDRDVFKKPKSDSVKASKAGKMTLVKDIATGSFSTIRRELFNPETQVDLMQTVYLNGDILVDTTLAEIRERARVV